MRKKQFYLYILFLVFFFANNAQAQWLEVKNEKDARSVSIKIKDGVPSSRIIFSSSLMLNYSSNMGDIDSTSVGRGEVNGLYSDTIYFFLPPDDVKRRITIASEGYPPIIIPYVFAPKETYRCFVFDPNKSKVVSENPNDPDYQHEMANKLEFGKGGFSVNHAEARKWYQRAAEQGYGLSQVALGRKYAEDAIMRDSIQSAKWFLEAAKKNYDTAQYAIGERYLKGNGLMQDSALAYRWFMRAAENGRDTAHYKMSFMLLNNFGTTADVDKQLQWFQTLVDQNNAEAQYIYGRLLIERKNSPENEKQAIELIKQAATQTYDEAMLYLGAKYFENNFSQRDVIKGMQLLRMAKEVGSFYADSVILDIENTVSDQDKFIYTKHFADKGIAADMAKVGNMYYYGKGTTQDYSKAFDYFSKSAKLNNGTGLNGVGLCYYHGRGIEKDVKKAYDKFTEAIPFDGYNAGLSLGNYYNNNDSLLNIEKAKIYYTISATAGNPVAQNKLGLLIFKNGFKTIISYSANGDVETKYEKPTAAEHREAIRWLKKSSDQDYFEGRYNYAYCLIALMDNNALKNSRKGKDAMGLFRSLAESGYKDAMIALSTYHKFNIGVDIAEAYKWRQKAAEDGDIVYKALLGCFENDEAWDLVKVLNKPAETIRAIGLEKMLEVAKAGCTFVYPRITYYYEITKDRKQARTWRKKTEVLTANQLITPDKVDFIL